QNTKVTISLSSESVAYFKEAAKKIIRQLLDEYVSHQKSANKALHAVPPKTTVFSVW
ncbi:RelB/StbD replicon stabilization protein (antitoxin to RelE/StbE), partial [hydrothermal vent metagenome]